MTELKEKEQNSKKKKNSIIKASVEIIKKIF